MNLLIDLPPETVLIGDTEYPINTDFRVSVLFELMMQDDTLTDYDKIVQSIELYFPEFPVGEDTKEIFEAIRWFYKCGRSDKERKSARSDNDKGESRLSTQRAYSFDYDDEYIYAAFRQQYGINLSSIKYMHWWEFRALFKGLDPDCQFCKIMGYRTAKITSGMSKSEKAFLRRMKMLHALPVSEKEQEENDALVNALMNGGDVSGILNKGNEDERNKDGQC